MIEIQRQTRRAKVTHLIHRNKFTTFSSKQMTEFVIKNAFCTISSHFFTQLACNLLKNKRYYRVRFTKNAY